MNEKPLILSYVPQWIEDLSNKYPNGARWSDERGTWEAVEPRDLDLRWHTDELIPIPHFTSQFEAIKWHEAYMNSGEIADGPL